MHKHSATSWIGHYKLTLTFLLLSTLVLSGCIKDQPSEADIKSMVADRFDQDFNGLSLPAMSLKTMAIKRMKLTMSLMSLYPLRRNSHWMTMQSALCKAMNLTLLKK